MVCSCAADSWGNGDPDALRMLVKEAADVGRSIADQVAPLERTVDSGLEASLDVDLDKSVMEMS